MNDIDQSPLLSSIAGLAHGFSTRRIGDMGRAGGGPAFASNRRALLSASGIPDGVAIAEVDQVHGARVVTLDAPLPEAIEADAIVTSARGVAIGVRTADCAPILLAYAPAGRPEIVAAVHAGWRGAVARIVQEALQSMIALGARPSAVHAAIGPTIGPGAFQVGEEVVDAARRALDGAEPPYRRADDGTAYFDLRAFVARQLADAGVPRAQIEPAGGCTASDLGRYYSHRRERGNTGRQLSVIAIVSAPSPSG